MIEVFLRREDQRRYSLSQHELERRWKAVRERMDAKGIDYLVFQSQQRYLGGYFRWFTDEPGANFSIAAVFSLEDGISITAHGSPAPAPPSLPPPWALRGVTETINKPFFPNVYWMDAWNAEKLVEVMLRKKPRTVGLVGLGNMSASLYENLKKGLPDVNFINATELVDEVRMVKSEEELKLHREAAYLHEMSYEVAKKAIRPGRLATEVIEEIRHAQVLDRSEEQYITITFGQPGVRPFTQGTAAGNRFIRRPFKRGDIVNLLIESSAAGGYWYDLRRFFSLGAPSKELQEAYKIAKEARNLMAANLKPGALTAAALSASDEFLLKNGCPPESRAAGHGQGLDLVERPVIHAKEPAILSAGMVISLHPTAKTKQAAASISDTYVVGDSGAVPLYRNLFEDGDITVIE